MRTRRRSRSRLRSHGSGRSGRIKIRHRRVRGASGFGLFTARVLANLFMEHQYGTNTFDRGIARHHRRFRRAARAALRGVATTTASTGATPPRRCGSSGCLILPAARAHADAVLHAERRRCSRSWASRRRSCCSTALHDGRPVLISRSCRTGCGAWARRSGSIYIFFIGATGGALLSGLLTDEFGARTAVCRDRDPVDDHRRAPDPPRRSVHPQRPVPGGRRAAGGDGRARAPAGQAAGLDPCVAGRRHRLLVRAGAGALRRRVRGAARARCSRCSAPTARASRRSSGPSPGSGTPARGVVRLNGRTITYTTPEQRARLGIRILLGRQGRVPGDDGAREPRDGGVHVPR